MHSVIAVAILLICCLFANGFILPSAMRAKRTFLRKIPNFNNEENDFDGAAFEEALKKAPGGWGTKDPFRKSDSEVLDKIRKEQEARAEEIFRVYPFTEKSLPVLPDCNNYYSGKFEEFFWHQNADQVYVYIPISDEISKNDVSASFEAKKVSVSVKGKQVIEFECLERIIPDGSFWVIEKDGKDEKKFIQLDLEKRFRMINWKSLFGAASKEVEEDLESRRSKMLEKLFSANKGISKLTGAEPESIDEMEQNEILNAMISSDVDTNPRVVDEDGNIDFDAETSADLQESFREAMEQIQREVGERNVIDVEDESKKI